MDWQRIILAVAAISLVSCSQGGSSSGNGTSSSAPPQTTPEVSCPAGEHAENVFCVVNERACVITDTNHVGNSGFGRQQWAAGSWGPCVLESCAAGYEYLPSINECALACSPSQHRNLSNPLLCDPNILTCSITFGSGRRIWNATNATYSACEVVSCNSGYEIYNNTCIQQCAAGQHRNPSSNSCDPDLITCNVPNGLGQQQWNPATTSYGACVPTTCFASHHIENNQCLPNVKSCDPLPANVAVGTQTWNGNAYDACVPSTCLPHHHQTGNSCEPNSYQLSFSKETAGGVLTSDLLTCGTNCSTTTADYVYGLNTQTILQFAPAPGYDFLGWTGSAAACGLNLNCTLPLDGNKTFGVSVHLRSYELTVVVENGSILGGSSGTYEHGTTFNFTTTPAAEYVFNGWSGACSGLGTSCSVFMDSNKVVVANYVALHQVCDPLPPHATSASQTWNGTAYGVCEIANCAPGYALANNVCESICAVDEHFNEVLEICEPAEKSCDVDNGLGVSHWDGSAYGPCELVSCNAGFHEDAGICLSNTRVCSVPHGAGEETWNNGWGSCQVLTCDLNFHVENNACVDDVRACVVTHGSGWETWLGNQYSECVVQDCDSSYHVFNNQCDPDVISCAEEIVNSVEATQTWNGTAYAACELLSCQTDYHADSNVCVSNFLDCTADIVNALFAQRIWTGSTFGICELQTCLSSYHVASNLCENDVITCSVPFATSASQTWNGTAYGDCLASACISGYHVENGVCEPTIYPLSLSLGNSHTMAVMSNFSVKGTGENADYQLGDGTNVNSLVPKALPNWGTGVKTIIAGNFNSCAIYNNSTVKCLGRNTAGQLSVGSTSPVTEPTEISAWAGAKDLGISANNICAIMADDSVKCAGSAAALGLGTGLAATTAVVIPGFANAKKLYMNSNAGYTCATMLDNSVKCVGANTSGQLGLGNTTNRTTPVVVAAYAGAKKLSPGDTSLCAILADDSVWCSGTNQFGQLGTGASGGFTSTPVAATAFAGAKEIVAGVGFRCALYQNNSVRCVGSNSAGQLGVGTSGNFTSPQLISGYANAVSIYAGSNHSCALFADNSVKCSGYNTVGTLGDGTNIIKQSPVLISY